MRNLLAAVALVVTLLNVAPGWVPNQPYRCVNPAGHMHHCRPFR